MLKKIYAVLFAAFTAGNFALAQNGILKGKVVDEGNGEGVSFANVQLEQGGSAAMKTVADIDGNFTLKPIPPGRYDLKSAAVGFQTLTISGVIIGSDKTTYQDMKLKSMTKELPIFEVIEYEKPLVRPDNVQGKDITREEFQAMATKSITSVVTTSAGAFQKDEGGDVNIRGGRSSQSSKDFSGTAYYIDGEKVRGSLGLPQNSIEQISVITGGVPASLGDATGGVVNITTRGGMRNELFGSAELISSQLTDAYGYNFAGANVGGPLLFEKDTVAGKQAKLGFFLSGEIFTEKDPSPSAVGLYKVKDEKLQELEQTPLAVSETSGGGTLLNAELLRWDDLEHIKAKQNTRKNSIRLDGKLDFKANENLIFTLGGSMDYGRYHDFVYEYALLNPSNNPEYIYNTMRLYGKVRHNINPKQSKDDKSTSLLKNAYYILQAGYTKHNEIRQDDDHKDKFFDYGYIGMFETKRAPMYQLVIDTSRVPSMDTIYEQVVWADTQVVFNAGTANPLATNYTNQYYDLIAGEPNTLTDIQAGYGLLNGDRPRSVYSIWYNTGRQYNGYSNLNYSQFRISGQFSADIKNHAIQAGFEWEKRDDRYWLVGPIGLWGLMRQLANKHITQLDTTFVQESGPILLTTGTILSNPGYDGAYSHPYIINSSTQSQFDKSLRESLGITDNGKWIDIDSYDPSTFDISMFSADELLNDGNSYISYFGYTYDGEKMKGKDAFDLAALENFYKEKDANGNYTRTIPSFQPVYTAGYIQDRFDIKDMKFNIGMRIDRFNANQPVLKDQYLLYEAKTVDEVNGTLNPNGAHPTNIPSDAVVYVDDATNPNSVLGYRDGDKWYNALGVPVSTSDLVTPSSGVIQPYLKYPGEQFLDSSKVENIFQMYEVQNTFMPRISFAFPISDRANFFAHYDVLTQRPPAYLRFDPLDYLYIQTVGGVLNNPALKPERTIDYEVGFSQVLSERKNSALTLSGFYRQMRDMIQEMYIYGAYPIKYITFGNIDFGNVIGFTAAFDLRRTENVSLNAAYTLQFAEGTGSAATSAGGIIAIDQPNLRTTMPLDFDQRHAVVLTTDYRFGEGTDYRGPSASWAKKFFENFGGNVVFRVGSGLPYTRQKNVTSGNGDNSSAVIFGINQRASMKGRLNGSNLPWQYRMDLRLDKIIPITWKKEEGEGKGKKSNLTVYVQILNVLNTKNVLNLYRYTGDPDDDGYLDDPATQSGLSNYIDPQSFRDLYNAKIANPSHYSIPRRTRIGLVLDF